MSNDETDPPRDFIVDAKPAPGDASSGSGSGMAPIVIPVIIAGFIAKYWSLSAAVAVLGLGIAFYVLRQKPDLGRFVLRVEDKSVIVMRERSKDAIARIAIDDITDVALDKEMQASGGRAGGTAERVHIALHRREPGAPVLVPEARITPIEGQEWQGKVRVFLRKHGWLPLDERAADDAT